MKIFKSILWTVKNAFSFSPFLFICYFVVQFVRSTLYVYVTVQLGNIISSVQEVFVGSTDLDSIIKKLIMFGVLNIVQWLLIEIRWRFSDDYMPIRGEVGATKFLIKTSQNIPLRNWDDAGFCDRFYTFTDSIYSQPSILRSYIGIANTVYSFALAITCIAQYNIIFLPIFFCVFIVGALLACSTGKYRQMAYEEAVHHNRRADYLNGMFFGIYNRETRIFGLCDDYISKWSEERRMANTADINGAQKVSKIDAIIDFLCNNAGSLLLLVISVVFAIKGSLAVGAVYTVWQLSTGIFGNTRDVMNILETCSIQTQKSKKSYDTYIEICGYTDNRAKSNIIADENSPAINIQNLDFSYTEDKKVLSNINLSVKKGEIIALLGENGSGKSTLIKLILGLYNPQCGVVQVFGNDASIDEEYIRSNISTIFQDFCTYPFTLRENVGFGNPDNMDNDACLIESLHLAQADSVLDEVGSLDAILGRTIEHDGKELSGGQWQRLAIARTLFAKKKIMILDEPAAKLDPLAEEKQFSRLISQARKNGATVILVSHRVGFARMADKIVLLKNGEIAESGTHSELLEKKGEYAKMFNTQREMYATWEEKLI